ncbi:MAG: glycoside hydrolase family 3 C-terminal domain-containing protein [Bifidobacteriaceae bacterium]|nr:glycoside hydrolase family 3 C-terminal domain-containing protein [Bifidobacteriaceae bacterium]
MANAEDTAQDTTDEAPNRPKRPGRPISNRKFLGIWIPLLAFAAILVTVLNLALITAGGWVASQLGSGTYSITNPAAAADWDTTYYKTDFTSAEEADQAARRLIAEIGGEGMVLAKNTAAALPLNPGAKVTMLGRAAADPVYGGSGSGSITVTEAVTPRQSLEMAGFEVNQAAFEAIAAFADANPRGYIEMDKPAASTYEIGEAPVSFYQDVAASFAAYSDAALVFIGRPGGEGGDLTKDMAQWDANYQPGQHQLELNQDELDLIDLAADNFSTVVVIVNASTSLELGPVQDHPGVSAVILAGSPGLTGFDGLGRVLSGSWNPSGRTVDTWAADFTADPSFANFGGFIYSDLEVSYPASALEAIASNAETTTEAAFVNYAEGIYTGYRYYETAAAEGLIDYGTAVVYPFGFGLSYTSFEWRLDGWESGAPNESIAATVTVSNTGQVAGKEVVELYFSPPYQPGGIEKADAVLAAFAKTDVIAPGDSQTVRLEFAVQDMASYDHREARAYVLEAGDYVVSLRTDSHHLAGLVEPLIYTVPSTLVYGPDNPRSGDLIAATNQFDDLNQRFSTTKTAGQILEFSRADFAGTFPAAPSEDLYQAGVEVVAGFAAWDQAAAAAQFTGPSPVTGQPTSLSLMDLRGLAKDDPKWQELLDSLSLDDMSNMLLNGAYQTLAVASIGKPSTVETDGPAGFSSFINADINGLAYPSAYSLAQTWNTDSLHQMGAALGNEALFKGINGWYAPAMNIHRSPFGGRNFEYYSEDPLLSGQMAAAVANGAATKGLYTFFKHFALNEQEANRVNNGVATWATEQAVREVYLRPFEIAVKGVTMEVPYILDAAGSVTTAQIGATAIMSSFNRIGAVWAGGSAALMTNVLRHEWGFEGFAVSDFNIYRYMDPNQSIWAGTDLTLTFAPSKSFSDTTSGAALNDIRRATHNILFTVVNSNAMNHMAPGAEINYTPPTWVYVQILGSVGVGLIILGGTVWVVRRVRRQSRAAADGAKL